MEVLVILGLVIVAVVILARRKGADDPPKHESGYFSYRESGNPTGPDSGLDNKGDE